MAQIVEKATSHFNKGEYEESLKLFEEALKELPTEEHSTIHVNVGAALINMGEIIPAIAAFDEALKLDPTNIEASLNKGLALTSTDKHSEALVCFENVTKNAPDFYSGHVGKSEALANLGNYSAAVESASKAISLDSSNPLGYADKAFALLKSRDFFNANDNYEQALKLGDDSDETKVLFGMSLAQAAYEKEALGDRENASQLLHRANIYNPTPSNLHNEAIMLVTTFREDEGITCLKKAIQLDSNYFDPYVVLGTIYAQREQLPEAIQNLEKACALEPSSPRSIEPRFNLGVMRLKNLDVEGARKEWLTVLQIEPGEPNATEALRMLDAALAQAKKTPSADIKSETKDIAKKIANLNPSTTTSPLPKLVLGSDGKILGMSTEDADKLLATLDRLDAVLSGNSTDQQKVNEEIDKVAGEAAAAAQASADAANKAAKEVNAKDPASIKKALDLAAAAANAANTASAIAAAQAKHSPIAAANVALAAANAAEASANASRAAMKADPLSADMAHITSNAAAEAAKNAIKAANDAMIFGKGNAKVNEGASNAVNSGNSAIKATRDAAEKAVELKGSEAYKDAKAKLRSVNKEEKPSSTFRPKVVPFGQGVLKRTGRLTQLGGRGFTDLEDKLQGSVQNTKDQYQAKQAAEIKPEIEKKPTIQYKTPGDGDFHTYEELKSPKCPVGVDPLKKEMYLNDADFKKVFGKTKDEFAKFPAWKKAREKQSKYLF